jgi:hypothetical protein
MSVQVEGYRNESFESLEAAVLETSRGRWFLEEYAKRQRSAETLAILEILKKLENSITNTSFLPPAKNTQALKSEQLKFFRQDEEIFVEPAIVPTSLSVVKKAPPAEPAHPAEPKGAKLKIQRMQPSQSSEAPAAVEPKKPAASAAASEPVASLAPPPAAEPKQRVVIIRRPASEANEIPLMEDSKSEAAA